MNWLFYALLTVGCWGIYGIFLHTGAVGMADPVNGRIKAFLFVGVAYFLTAVLAPIIFLAANGASWTFPSKGLWWSLLAGILGAVGALGVLLAFGAKGSPAVVMAIVFAGAPVINALVAIIMHPPAGGWGGVKPQFYLGILLAALGGCLVSYYKPPAAPAKSAATAPPTTAQAAATPSPAAR